MAWLHQQRLKKSKLFLLGVGLVAGIVLVTVVGGFLHSYDKVSVYRLEETQYDYKETDYEAEAEPEETSDRDTEPHPQPEVAPLSDNEAAVIKPPDIPSNPKVSPQLEQKVKTPRPELKPVSPGATKVKVPDSNNKSTKPKTLLVVPTAKWWLEAWPKSAVHKTAPNFVGDQPFFPACTEHPRARRRTAFFMEPKPFIKNSKNPCWYENPQAQRDLRCLPYVFLAGVAKCGTTDLAKRLRMHPDMFEGTVKEYHWWERDRFDFVTFDDYLEKITGKELLELQSELKKNGFSNKIFGDFSPSYLWEPRNWEYLHGNQECKEPRIIHAQHIHHINPDAKIILIFRHPTSRLYSRFVSRIPRTPELKGNTNVDFHRYVENGIKVYKDCFQRWSVRHCAYNDSTYFEAVVRLVEGMYPVFMHDWLRVWPKEQMFIMRYEDYGGHERERLTELMDFLGLAKLNETGMDALMAQHIINSGYDKYQAYGHLLPETKKLLDDFYQPFINQFAQLMNDRRFLWQDISTEH